MRFMDKVENKVNQYYSTTPSFSEYDTKKGVSCIMQLLKVLIIKERGKSPCINYNNNTIKCLQQSDIADNDGLEFTKPMADFLAYILVN